MNLSFAVLNASELSFVELIKECVEQKRFQSPCLSAPPTPLYIMADDGSAIPVLEINTRLSNINCDCRSNNFMYPFKKNETKFWYWLPSTSVDPLLIGDGWKFVPNELAASGDIIVVRRNFLVKSVFYIERIYKNSTPWKICVSYKMNDEPPKTSNASFPFIQDQTMNLQTQVWSRR